MRAFALWAAVTALAAIHLATGFAGAPAGVALAVAAASGVAGLVSASRFLPVILFAAAVAGGLPVSGGAPGAFPWPSLLVLCFGSGALFARLLAPVRRRAVLPSDRVVSALAALWALSAVVAVVSARSIWAIARGLKGRVVNVQGMTDLAVDHDVILTLAAVLSGILLYGLFRAMESPARDRALSGLLAGSVLSALVAFLQSRLLIAAPRRPYWVATGRFQGLSTDPNALGVLLGLAMAPAVAVAFSGPRSRRLRGAASAVVLAAGLAASGSRSGFIVMAVGVLVLVATGGGLPGGRLVRLGAAAVLLGAVVWMGAAAGGGGRGSLGRRLVRSFDSEIPLAGRASSRPLLWSAAWKAWRESPVGGIGWNAYSWHLADLAGRRGVSLPSYDNPGNFYLQALCETGVAGAALFLAFMALAVVAATRRCRGIAPTWADSRAPGIAASVIGFAVALIVGSHLMAPEVAIAFFALVAAVVSADVPRTRSVATADRGWKIASGALVATSLLACLPLLASTGRAEVAFGHAPRIGFYGVEPSPKGPFRWMDRRAAWRFAPGERHTVALSFADPVHPIDRFRLYGDGRLLYRAELTRGGSRTLTLLAPADRPAIFRFVNSSSFRPASAVDDRDLAMQAFEPPPAP